MVVSEGCEYVLGWVLVLWVGGLDWRLCECIGRYRWDWGWVWWLGLRLEVAPVVPVPAYSCCLLGWLLELAVCVWVGER